MSKPIAIFKRLPEKETVISVLQELGFYGLDDKKLFSKKDISFEKFQELVFLIEPYYLPCKVNRFLYNVNQNSIITVLRHLLRAIGYDLLVKEKVVDKTKHTVYQIQQKVFDLSDNYIMTF
jgi:hypothetical protein